MSKAIIFDFDGVIVLSEHVRFHALQQSAKKYGLHIDNDQFKNINGRTTKYFFNMSFPELDEAVLDKIIVNYTKEYKDKIVDLVTPVTATIEFIKEYAGPKLLAVASGSTTVMLDTVLNHIGILDKFICVLGQEHVTKHKPDPEVYNLAARQLGCSNEDCIVIEDTVLGAEAAISAGMPVYIFLNGVNRKIDFEHMKVAGFLETYEQVCHALA
ncbi:HAD family phosphatase [Polaromonas sp.]|nr:HAD family phosphatase [Candidatus Saccharibacteria bacterium]